MKLPPDEFTGEALFADRLRALAAHHDWDVDQLLMRIGNALLHATDVDLETFLWSIDHVAMLEGECRGEGSSMLDSTHPDDRQDRLLARIQAEDRGSGAQVKSAVFNVMADEQPRTASEIAEDVAKIMKPN